MTPLVKSIYDISVLHEGEPASELQTSVCIKLGELSTQAAETESALATAKADGVRLKASKNDPQQTFINLINFYCVLAHRNSASHGFWDWYEAHKNEPESVILWKLSRIALIHSEASECVEGIRKNLSDDHLTNRSMEIAELADTVIRVFDYCGGHELPLAEVILEKMAYNAKRPHMHGDKKA